MYVPPNKYPVAIQGGSISPSDNFSNQCSDTDFIDEGVALLETVNITTGTASITFSSPLYGKKDWRRYEMLRWIWYPVIDNPYGTGIDYTYIKLQTASWPTYTVHPTAYSQLMSGNNPNTGNQTTVNSLTADAVICGMMGRDTTKSGNFMICDYNTGYQGNRQASFVGFAGGYHAGSYFTGGLAITAPQPTLKAEFTPYIQTGSAVDFLAGTTVSLYGFYGNDGGIGEWE